MRIAPERHVFTWQSAHTGFNRSSQHLPMMEVVGGATPASWSGWSIAAARSGFLPHLVNAWDPGCAMRRDAAWTSTTISSPRTSTRCRRSGALQPPNCSESLSRPPRASSVSSPVTASWSTYRMPAAPEFATAFPTGKGEPAHRRKVALRSCSAMRLYSATHATFPVRSPSATRSRSPGNLSGFVPTGCFARCRRVRRRRCGVVRRARGGWWRRRCPEARDGGPRNGMWYRRAGR